MSVRKWVFLMLAGLLAGSLAAAPPAFANDVAVSNVELKTPTASTVVVEFDLSQANPFGDLTDANSAAFSDYVYVFIKYDTDTIAEETNGWPHATLQQTGSSAAFTVTSDGKGAFIKASSANINLQLVWNYATDSVASTATARVKVMAIEMVYIPQGQFVYNAGSIGVSTWNNYGGATQTTVSLAAHVPTGAASGWPNGFNAFYVGKYEVSQGQYADFLNTISAANGTARYPGQATYQHTITYTSGNPYGSRYAASNPARASNFLSWDDTVAYLDWAALRPMTEMEFEKSARGGGTNTNTYPWGIASPDTDNGDCSLTPTATNCYQPSGHSGNYDAPRYYTNYFDKNANTDGYDGPTNVGNYLSGDLARSSAQTGASPYGVADMAGNNWEHLINCNKWDGGGTVAPTPLNGDGNFVVLPASWPGAATGKGLRGGSWYSSVANGDLRVSDRSDAEWTNAARYNDVGFRPARTP